MTQTQRAELRAAHAKTEQSPRQVDELGIIRVQLPKVCWPIGRFQPMASFNPVAEADFATMAHQHVPALLDLADDQGREVEALRVENERLRTALEEALDDLDTSMRPQHADSITERVGAVMGRIDTALKEAPPNAK